MAGPATSCSSRAGRRTRSATPAPELARLLVLHAPAMDGYFEELHRLWASGQPPATEQERALMARFGMEPA